MKKLSYYFSMTLLAATVVFSTSCKKDEDDPTPDNLSPDVTLEMNSSNGTGTDNENHTVKNTDGTTVLQVTAVTTSGDNMRRLYVYKTEDNGSRNNVTDWSGFKQDGNGTYYYDIPNDSKNNFTIKRKVNVSSNTTRDTDVYEFYFTTDSDFNVNIPGSNLVIGPGTITLIYDVDLSTSKTEQKMFNICSSSFPSAYNLQNLSGVSATVDPTTSFITVGEGADMAQQTGFANCGTFNGWVGQNSTTFVKAESGFDFSNATRNMAEDAFDNGTASSTVSDVSQGDIYIANLRGEGKYAVIRVTEVHTTDSDNNDYYKFDVKK